LQFGLAVVGQLVSVLVDLQLLLVVVVVVVGT
jgi:hypothetical protein